MRLDEGFVTTPGDVVGGTTTAPMRGATGVGPSRYGEGGRITPGRSASSGPGVSVVASALPMPDLPAADQAGGAATTGRTVPAPARHRLVRQAQDAGHTLDAVLLCAFGDILAARSRNRDFAIIVRRCGPHQPHSTGVPAMCTVHIATVGTDSAVPFTDRVAALDVQLHDTTTALRIPDTEPVGIDGCQLTIRHAHRSPCPPPAPSPVSCVVTIFSGQLRIGWAAAAGLKPGLLEQLADAHHRLVMTLADDELPG